MQHDMQNYTGNDDDADGALARYCHRFVGFVVVRFLIVDSDGGFCGVSVPIRWKGFKGDLGLGEIVFIWSQFE